MRRIRVKRELRMLDVADAVGIDIGHLSRIETGKQVATAAIAEKLATYYGHAISEMEIIYPERYVSGESEAA